MTLKQTKRKVTDEDDVEEIIFTRAPPLAAPLCSNRVFARFLLRVRS